MLPLLLDVVVNNFTIFGLIPNIDNDKKIGVAVAIAFANLALCFAYSSLTPLLITAVVIFTPGFVSSAKEMFKALLPPEKSPEEAALIERFFKIAIAFEPSIK